MTTHHHRDSDADSAILTDWPTEAESPDEFHIGRWLVERRWKGNSQPDTWEFVHDEYDGPGDGSPEEQDPRCGCGRTLAEVREAIEELETPPPAPREGESDG